MNRDIRRLGHGCKYGGFEYITFDNMGYLQTDSMNSPDETKEILKVNLLRLLRSYHFELSKVFSRRQLINLTQDSSRIFLYIICKAFFWYDIKATDRVRSVPLVFKC